MLGSEFGEVQPSAFWEHPPNIRIIFELRPNIRFVDFKYNSRELK